MSYDVHMHIVGDAPDPVFGILRSDRPIDRLYLFCDDTQEHVSVMENIIASLDAVGINDVIDVSIDPLDYDSTLAVMVSILNDESRDHEDLCVHANFTSGDAVSVIALRHAVDSFDNDMYYIRKGKAVSMGANPVSDITTLRIQTKVLDTFKRFKESDTISNRDLMGDLSAPALSYRTKELDRMGLITKVGTGRNQSWKITSKGECVLKRF